MDTADHVWIDHVRFIHLGDGMIDSRKDTTFLTVSWNILENHNKAFGIGWTENVTAQMTIHHNWIHDTNQRNPSTDNVLRAHLFNNLMENFTSYGNYARGGTNMVLQNSTFVEREGPALLRHRHAGRDRQRLPQHHRYARVDGDDVFVLRSRDVLFVHARFGRGRRGAGEALRGAARGARKLMRSADPRPHHPARCCVGRDSAAPAGDETDSVRYGGASGTAGEGGDGTGSAAEAAAARRARPA